MTPAAHAEALRHYAERVHQLAHERVENAVRANVAHHCPPGVSVTAHRTPTGVTVLVSGPGARAHAARLRRRLTPVTADAVRQAARR
jgi:hypothetical protein